MSRALALLALLLVGCPDAAKARRDAAAGSARGSAKPARPQPWPALPRSLAAARALIKRRTRRRLPAFARAALSARVAKVLATPARLVSGRAAIAVTLRRTLRGARGRAFLLLGTFHDARAQLAAFDWLVGAGGVAGFDALVNEHLDAQGLWRGVAPARQRGELALMLRAARGDATALWRSQARHDYTAWKYGYIDRVIGLVSTARGSGARALPCDMARPLQKLLPDGAIDGAPVADRLREIHCLLALRRRAPRARRVAMLWGQAHLGWRALARFLPAQDLVVAVDVFGGRQSEIAPARGLGRELALLGGPLLAVEKTPCEPPRCPLRALLLLPDRWLAGRYERVRDWQDKPPAPGGLCRLILRSTRAATLVLSGRAPIALSPKRPTMLLLPAGAPRSLTYVVTPRGKGLRKLVGALRLRGGSEVELALDPPAAAARLLIRAPRPSSDAAP